MMHTERRAMAVALKRQMPRMTIKEIAACLRMTPGLVKQALSSVRPHGSAFARIAACWAPHLSVRQIAALSITDRTTVQAFQAEFRLQGTRRAA